MAQTVVPVGPKVLRLQFPAPQAFIRYALRCRLLATGLTPCRGLRDAGKAVRDRPCRPYCLKPWRQGALFTVGTHVTKLEREARGRVAPPQRMSSTGLSLPGAVIGTKASVSFRRIQVSKAERGRHVAGGMNCESVHKQRAPQQAVLGASTQLQAHARKKQAGAWLRVRSWLPRLQRQ